MTLRTYDPNRPEWGADTPELASLHERDAFGMLVETGPKTASKQLILVMGGDDAEEQSGHKPVRYIVDELLSGSNLAQRLLRKFSFLILPFTSHQGIRDGFSRFGYDTGLPGVEGNLSANGGSDFGSAVARQAVLNWVSDHPNPAFSVFCCTTVHCDNVNRTLTVPGGVHQGDPTTPTAPYGQLVFPGHLADADGGAAVFRNPDMQGYDSIAWPEYLKGTNLTKGGFGGIDVSEWGGTTFYFEQPWRHSANKASFFYRQDAYLNFARAVLAGIATVAGTFNVYDEEGADVGQTADVVVDVIAKPETVADAAKTADVVTSQAVQAEVVREAARAPDTVLDELAGHPGIPEVVSDAAKAGDQAVEHAIRAEAVSDAAREGDQTVATARLGEVVTDAGKAADQAVEQLVEHAVTGETVADVARAGDEALDTARLGEVVSDAGKAADEVFDHVPVTLEEVVEDVASARDTAVAEVVSIIAQASAIHGEEYAPVLAGEEDAPLLLGEEAMPKVQNLQYALADDLDVPVVLTRAGAPLQLPDNSDVEYGIKYALTDSEPALLLRASAGEIDITNRSLGQLTIKFRHLHAQVAELVGGCFPHDLVVVKPGGLRSTVIIGQAVLIDHPTKS